MLVGSPLKVLCLTLCASLATTDPRLSGSKLMQEISRNDYKTGGDERVSDRRSSIGVDAQHERIQAYTNNSLALNMSGVRNKLQKLRHPSTSRQNGPPGLPMSALNTSGGAGESALNTSTSGY